jgi:uncharacterized membrane protein (UPF0127 family)
MSSRSGDMFLLHVIYLEENGLITDIVSDVAPATGKVDTYNCHFHRRQNKNWD